MKIRFDMPGRQFSEMLDWCIENFGVAYLHDNSWDTYQHSMLNENNSLIPCRVFIFYREEDAMAFKLRWTG